MRKIFTFFATLLAIVAVNAATYDFSSSIPDGWTASPAPTAFESTNLARGAQWSKANGTLTLKGCTDVMSITIVASSNVASGYTVSATVGGNAIGSEFTMPKENNTEVKFSAEAAMSGDVVISFTQGTGAKSFYVKSITVEGNVEEPGEPSTPRLDPDYEYVDEPVVILPKDALGKMAIDTVVNNIWLQCAEGAYYESDIRIYAGKKLTITASKPIVAIKVDGVVKQGFSAEASAGEITYMTDAEAESEGTPVLLVKNINAESVVLTCVKQLQMKALYVYFLDNPEDEIGGGSPTDPSEEPEAPSIDSNVTSTGDFPFINATIDFTNWTIDQSLGLDFYTAVDEEGYFINDEGSELFFSFWPESSSDIVGTYTISGGTIDDEYSEIYVVEGETTIEDYFVSATLTITKEADGTYTVNYTISTSENGDFSGTVSGVRYEDLTVTGIEDVNADVKNLDFNAPMYNVLGQPVKADYRGVVIQNGRKYLRLQ